MSVVAAEEVKSETASASSLPDILEREFRVWRLIREDDTIHPADALAAVVWPRKREERSR